MALRKGIVPTAQPTAAPAPVARIIGRTAQAVITTPTQSVPQPQARIITKSEAPRLREGPVRGLLVGNDGKPLRGLSQQTLEAHKAYSEDATERCMNCGRMVPPKYMKTVVANAYNSNNPLRLCDTPPVQGEAPSCISLAYRDVGRNDAPQAKPWRPSIPAVRFDRETAAPYDARQRGVTIRDLTTRDTYHNEREVPSQFKTDVLIGEGRWSGPGGKGHVVTRESVAASRDRAARARR